MIDTIIQGDCLEVMKEIPDNSIDCVITDPPAGIGFMGKEWDKDKGGRDNWITWLQGIAKECLRVLKPGGHALVWALPRTSHWTATAFENAGFEVRDRIVHCFGSGFPKSLNIGKAVDKLQGNEREVVGVKEQSGAKFKTVQEQMDNGGFNDPNRTDFKIDKGTSEYEGWGTALKPAVEDWWLLRKPLSEKTVAENVLKWGVGGLNIDECRIPLNGNKKTSGGCKGNRSGRVGYFKTDKDPMIREDNLIGRFPANLIIDDSEEVKSLFPNTKPSRQNKMSDNRQNKGNSMFLDGVHNPENSYFDSGSASRFFYCAKASRRERDKGCEELYWLKNKLIEKELWEKLNQENELNKDNKDFKRHPIARGNIHPTVKPIVLMIYLVKLICPPNGIVLDPFAGSGSTLIAAKKLGKHFVGIELNPEYVEIAKKRLNFEMLDFKEVK